LIQGGWWDERCAWRQLAGSEKGGAAAGSGDRRPVVLFLRVGHGGGAGVRTARLAKNNHVGRSFIVPTRRGASRSCGRSSISSKTWCAARRAVGRLHRARHDLEAHREVLRESGAAEIYFVSAAPRSSARHLRHRHVGQREIIAATTIPSNRALPRTDAVIYQSLDDLRALYRDLPCCYACFSGDYPTGASEELLKQIEQEKECSTRN
jgi:amidophosphoribosyltransferase